MELITIIELVSFLLCVAYLVYYYSIKSISLHIKLLTYFSWVISFGFLFIVPLDVYYTKQIEYYYKDNGIVVQNQRQLNNWNYDIQKEQDDLFEQLSVEKNRNNLRKLDLGDQQNQYSKKYVEKLRNLEEQEQLSEINNNVENEQNLENYNQIRIDQDGENLYNPYESEFKSIQVAWKAIWWICFFMTWIVLPFFQEYENAGDFTITGKIKTSIKQNLKLIGFMLVGGVIFVTYLAISGTVTCGLFLVVILLGHGMVALPKRYWREKDLHMTLKYCYYLATQNESDIYETQYKLEDETKFLQANIDKHSSDPNISQLQYILNLVPEYIQENARNQRQKIKVSDQLDVQKIRKMHKTIKGLVASLNKLKSKQEFNTDETFQIEDIIASRNNSQRNIQGQFWVSRSGTFGSFIDKLVWFWYTKMFKIYHMLFFGIFAVFSIIVLLGELSIFFEQNNLSIFAQLVNQKISYFMTQVFTLIPLLYITFCVYYGLFNIKIKGFFGFYSNHNTDSTSLMFGSINFTRVSAPICYNFLQMMNIKNTAFNTVMGEMDIFPQLQYLFPLLLIILSCFNLFDLYRKVLAILGFDQFQFSDDFNHDHIEDGQKIIARARKTKEKEFEQIKMYHKDQIKSGYNSQQSWNKINPKDQKGDSFEKGIGNSGFKPTYNSQSTSSINSSRENQAQKIPLGNNYYNFNNNQNYDDILNI
ncbi:hypothetical protein PPERSA_00563 [Pseudocohnilembus persalinus]|uniref:LMBR1-like membrane protein n=1 Tax=Pseudocohnilembus persalinus TaxID=266149 RepID=A0A0V0QSH1_PSEPJ|nr:hypothetical protein PPERSA_00563 [Pseudocohnilembus persalinus]|eukprot:KRX05262.1 hypothetical protein PPERSA_00563 [Pseudocohnilembus persalinus]